MPCMTRAAVRTNFLGAGKTSRRAASSIASREKWARTIKPSGAEQRPRHTG